MRTGQRGLQRMRGRIPRRTGLYHTQPDASERRQGPGRLLLPRDGRPRETETGEEDVKRRETDPLRLDDREGTAGDRMAWAGTEGRRG